MQIVREGASWVSVESGSNEGCDHVTVFDFVEDWCQQRIR